MPSERFQLNTSTVTWRMRAILSGQASPGSRVVEQMLRALASESLAITREAFLQKSAGGSDDAQARWPPLSARTLAERKRLWQRAYDAGRQHGRSADDAQAVAWQAVRAATGATASSIGIRTGRLLDSLRPDSAECKIEVQPGVVIVHTLVPYAQHFAASRPIFPDGDAMPDVWQARLARVFAEHLGEVALEAIRG